MSAVSQFSAGKVEVIALNCRAKVPSAVQCRCSFYKQSSQNKLQLLQLQFIERDYLQAK